MPHTKDELIKMIDLDEPDYQEIVSKLSKEDVPLLTELAQDPNPAIATKAISCLGHVNDDKAFKGVETATKSNNPILRVAATHALRNMSSRPGAELLLGTLLDDDDIGVKKFALKTVEASKFSGLKEKVQQLHLKETNDQIKALSRQVLDKL